MDKNFDVIYMSLFRWNGPYSSISEAMSKELSDTNRVFYINHPYSYKDYIQELKDPKYDERKAGLRKGIIQYEDVFQNVVSVIPPLTYPINFLPPGKIYDNLFQRNQKVVLDCIREVIKKYNIQRFVFLNCFNPFYAGVLPKEFGAKICIYQCVDDMAVSEYTIRHGYRLELEAIKNAGATTCTSRELHRLKAPHSDNCHIVHNAAETEIFETAVTDDLPVPEELRGVSGKIIGFVGNMDALRVDYPLIKKIAQHNQDKTLVLVGPVNNTEIKSLGIDTMPNVIMPGPKRIVELAPYLRRFDCAIIPFLCNTLTRSIYPLKINEYLAAGRAVISTSFSEDIQSFGDHIYLSDSHEAFLANINRAIGENSEEKVRERMAVAQSNSWASRIQQVWKIVNDHLEKKKVDQLIG